MKINAKFLKSVNKDEHLPYEKFQNFAVIGRSNVGKSSFINTITEQKSLAKTGSTPGVTKMANLYLINKKTYLTDLTGYGFAKASHKDRIELENLIFWYLSNQILPIKILFQIIDAEVGPTQLDKDIYEFHVLQNYQVIIIANKVDKIKSSKLSTSLQKISNTFHDEIVIPLSSKNGTGKKEVQKILLDIKS